MKKFTLALAALALTATMMWGSEPEINSPSAAGFLLRGRLLFSDNIFTGAFDQAAMAQLSAPGPDVDEHSLLLEGLAALRTGSDRTPGLLNDFCTQYPVSPLRPLAMIALGDWYFSQDEYDEAMKYYSAVNPRALAPSDRDDLEFRIAYVEMLRGNYAEALKRFSYLSSTDTYHVKATFYSGYIFYAQGEYEKALEYFRTTDTSSEPGNAAPYYMAQIYYLESKWERAYELSSRMIENPVSPSLTPEAERIAGEALYNMGDRDKALPYLWRYASSTQTPSPSAFYILGTSEYDAGHWSEAIGLLQKVIGEKNPTAQSAYLYLGQAYMHTDRPTAAIMAFEHAYRMNFDPKVSETALYNYIAARTEGGQTPFSDSVGLLEEFMRSYPDSPYAAKVSESLASGYLSSGDYDAALQAIKRVKNPSQALINARQRILFVLGTRQAEAGKWSEAERLLSEASSVRSTEPSVTLQSRLWEAEAAYRLKRYDKAAAGFNTFLKTAPKNDPNLIRARYGLGYTLFAQGKYAAATKDFEVVGNSATGSNEMRADAIARRADCLYYTGKIAEAERLYRRSYEASPATADYPLYQQALMQGLLRNQKEKQRLLDRLTSDYPTSPLIPDALMQKAESQIVEGNTEAAIATYLNVIERFNALPQGRRARLQLAITYLNSAKRDKAEATYRQLIAAYPTSEEARVAIDDLKRIYAEAGRLDEFARFLASIDGAPSIDPSEYDTLTFSNAEKSYATTRSTELLEKYLSTYPTGAHASQALFYLATAASEKGDHNATLANTSLLIKNYPHNENIENALLMQAEAENALGRTDHALDSYLALSQRTSDSQLLAEARRGAMTAALRLQRYKQARQAAEALASSTEGASYKAETAYVIGAAAEGEKDYDKAREAWTEAIAAAPASLPGVQSAVALSDLLLRRGDISGARSMIEDMLNANPPYPYWMARGFIVLSDILRRQGETFEADEYLRSLRANYPGHEQDIFDMIDKRLD